MPPSTAPPSGNPSVIEAAKSYLARGWKPVPIPRGTKGPNGNGWQNRKITPDNVTKLFKNGGNIGLQMGPVSGGLADDDADCPEAIALADYFLPPTNAVFGRKSTPRAHRLYVVTDAPPGVSNIPHDDENGERIAELRLGTSSGIQTMCPPSTHPDSGEVVTWSSNDEPARVPYLELARAHQLRDTAALFLRYWPKGESNRHTLALIVGGFLARTRLTVDEVEQVVSAVVTEAKDEQAKDRCRAATDAAKGLGTNNTCGYPKLAGALGENVAKALAKILAYQKNVDDWPQPLDMWASFNPPELPLGLLPQVIEDFALSEGRMMGADPAGLAMAALTACAAAIPDKIKLQPKRHDSYWLEAARLWVFLVGLPATMKTPIFNKASWPIKRIDRYLYDQYAAATAAYEALPKEEKETRRTTEADPHPHRRHNHRGSTRGSQRQPRRRPLPAR
jgi:hypothetical protein